MRISGVILSGGQGRRMGNINKGLVELHGQPLIAQAILRFSPQVSELWISANQDQSLYQALGYPVIADEIGEGPLAGIHSAMTHARHELVACIPCDSPLLPLNLVSRLHQGLQATHADIAVAAVQDHIEPVFCLLRCALLASLTAFLTAGGRKVDAWQRSCAMITVPFDDHFAFLNCNTQNDLSCLKLP